MPELMLLRSVEMLDIVFGENRVSVPLAEITSLNEEKTKRIHEDAVAYGHELFKKIFFDESMCAQLLSLHANDRLVLVVDDPQIAAIPWEYLRSTDGKLLASSLNFVRGIPEKFRQEKYTLASPLHIVVVPASPVNDSRMLNTEGEWKQLVKVVIKSQNKSMTTKAITITRVRPPEFGRMGQTLQADGSTIVHFMGHSDIQEEKGMLLFEDMCGWSFEIDAIDFARTLTATNVFLAVLNSCNSAVISNSKVGNIAQNLVYTGVPYALGMQFILPDDAAPKLNENLYSLLLQGHSVEEAMRRTRLALEPNNLLHEASWLVGVPVLYTNLREPLSPIILSDGQLAIHPDPEQLQRTCNLSLLAEAEGFVGYSEEINKALNILQSRPQGFVILQGIGGIGKTALARVITERISWYFDDRVLALSLETFTKLSEGNKRVINESFINDFCSKLALFYGIDPNKNIVITDLQYAIIQQREYNRSLLILDNIDTLIDAQKEKHQTARLFAGFIARLKEGDGAVLMTSWVTPTDWGKCEEINVSGLSDEDGARLFLTLLPKYRWKDAPLEARLKLSHIVGGHPLSIRLLVGRFAKMPINLWEFLKNIPVELESAEQITPTMLEDPNRQRTLNDCIGYSIKQLSDTEREVLAAISIFKTPFPDDFAGKILEQGKYIEARPQLLAELGLLEKKERTFEDGELVRFQMHPMLRWYIYRKLPSPDLDVQERYAQLYEELGNRLWSMDGYDFDQNASKRFLIRESMPDFEASLSLLPPVRRNELAIRLAKLYWRIGQNKRALELYEQSLMFYQDSDDQRGIALMQSALGSLNRIMGRPSLAKSFFEQAQITKQYLEDNEAKALIDSEFANFLARAGQQQEALKIFRGALYILEAMNSQHNIAVIKKHMADLLVEVGDLREALELYEQAWHSLYEFHDLYGIVLVRRSIAVLLWRKLHLLQDSLEILQQALPDAKEISDPSEVAIIQEMIGEILAELGKPEEGLAVLRQVSQLKQESGDKYGLWSTLKKIQSILDEREQFKELSEIHEQLLMIEREIEDKNTVPQIQASAFQLMVQSEEHPREVLAEQVQYVGSLELLPLSIKVPKDLFERMKSRLIDLPDIGMLSDEVNDEPQNDPRT